MNIKSLQMKRMVLPVLITLLLNMAGMLKVYAYDFTAVTTTGQTLYFSIINNNNHYVKMVYPGNSNNNPWGNIVKPTGTVLLPAMVDYNGFTWYVRYIDNYAFYGCFEITEAIISEGIISVGDYSFFGCTGLTTLTIGPTVTSIGDYAFWNCPSLTTVHYNAMNCTEMYTNYSGYHSVFNIGTTATGPTAITTLTIGNGVNRIPNYAFSKSPEILGVSFPQWLTNIGNNAFSDCENLASITLLSTTPPSVGSNAFSNISLGIPVFVPCNYSGTYATATGWSQFSNIIELCSNQIVAVAFPSNGGTVSGSGTYPNGYTCNLSATANPGYSFIHWRKNGEVVSTNTTYSFVVNGSGSYVAVFSETPSYNVTATANPTNGGTITGTGTYNQGQTCVLTASASTGYSFTNWTENGTVVSTNASYSFTVTGNRTLVANFIANPVNYTVSVSANPSNGGTVTGAGTYAQGFVCTVTATANSGYTFSSWTENGAVVSTSASYSFAVTSNRSLVANFISNPVNYIINVSANPSNGGTVTGGGSYQQGTTCTVTATANEGYYFFSWMENGEEVSASANYSFTVTSNRNLVAFFMADPVNCIINASASPSNGGSISGAGTYPLGQICTLIASANPGYTFMNWTEGLSWEAGGEIISTEASYSFTVTGNWNVVANFSSNALHWNVDVYQYPYTMSVTGIIQINGVEQAVPTLEIGAFCGDECRGSQRLTYFPQVNRYLVFLTLYGNTGDVMSFRLYDHALGEELDLSCSSTISFVPDGFIGVAIDPYVFDFGNVDQVSNFSQGYNWWGTYIEQNGINGLQMLQEGLGGNGVTIRSQVGYTDYYAGYGWYGSLSSVNNESSYRVITSAPCTVTMTGNAAVPSQHPITLSQGWTWIGYVPSTAMSVDAAMAGVSATQGDKLKSQHGYSEYYTGYGWFGSLNTLEPGMGLMYYSTNSNPVTFTYPDGNRGGELKQNLTAENNHWKPNTYAYPDNMTVMAVVDLNNVELNSEHYELAVFANGECRGSVKLTYAEPLHRHVAFLTISGKDAAELSFRLYDTETGMEYYDAEENLDFVADAMVGAADDLYTIHFRGMTGMDEFANRVQVYPNPVNAGERFSIGMATVETYPVHVEIVNALGIETLRATSVQTPVSIVAPNTAGIYTLRITVEGKETMVRKLIVK